jgi:hypothetical protein
MYFVLFTLITSPAFRASSLSFIQESASACFVLAVTNMSSTYAYNCLNLSLLSECELIHKGFGLDDGMREIPNDLQLNLLSVTEATATES